MAGIMPRYDSLISLIFKISALWCKYCIRQPFTQVGNAMKGRHITHLNEAYVFLMVLFSFYLFLTDSLRN